MKILFIQLLCFLGLGFFLIGGDVFANTPSSPQTSPVPKATTDFQHQNTEVLPGVPKASEGASNAEDLFGGDSADATKNLLSSIKTAINRVLGLLALIALIILIYQGVMMLVYARDSKKMEEGYATVKNVAIALVFIGVSWLVVSFIFRAIGQFTGT